MSSKAILATITVLAIAAPAAGQHSDVWLQIIDGNIVTTEAQDGVPLPGTVRVFAAEFGESGCPPFTADPGWRAAAGTFNSGSQIGWNAVDALKVWSGSGFTATGGEFLEVSFATLSFEVHDDGPADGFSIFVQPDGGVHQHLNFCMDGCPLVCTPPPAADPGIYLLNLEVTSTDAGTSEPIWLVFNYLDTEPDHDAAVAWVQDNLVSAPCPWDLDGGGGVGIGDFLDLLAAWGSPYGIDDFLALLADWGPC